MFDGPFYVEVQCTFGQMADNDLKRVDVDLCAIFALEHMKMWRRVFTPEHLNNNSKNWLIVGMICLAGGSV